MSIKRGQIARKMPPGSGDFLARKMAEQRGPAAEITTLSNRADRRAATRRGTPPTKIEGVFTIKNNPGQSKSGTCAMCAKMSHGLRHGTSTQRPPYHPNCKCTAEDVQ